jgi:hypothetical protein
MPVKFLRGEAKKKTRKKGLTSFSSHGTIGMEEENPIGKTFLTL